MYKRFPYYAEKQVCQDVSEKHLEMENSKGTENKRGMVTTKRSDGGHVKRGRAGACNY